MTSETFQEAITALFLLAPVKLLLG